MIWNTEQISFTIPKSSQIILKYVMTVGIIEQAVGSVGQSVGAGRVS